MYLGMTVSEDGRPAVCDLWSSEGHWWRWKRMGDRPSVIVGHQRDIGGAGLGLDVGQVVTECQGDLKCRLLDMWVCGGGEE